MKTLNNIFLSVLLITVSITASFAQDVQENSSTELKTYLIERVIPDAGSLSAEELQGISQKSCDVIDEMGPRIEWLHSYVTTDKVFCVYRALGEAELKEHAEKGGFPINSISEISTKIGPDTAAMAKTN